MILGPSQRWSAKNDTFTRCKRTNVLGRHGTNLLWGNNPMDIQWYTWFTCSKSISCVRVCCGMLDSPSLRKAINYCSTPVREVSVKTTMKNDLIQKSILHGYGYASQWLFEMLKDVQINICIGEAQDCSRLHSHCTFCILLWVVRNMKTPGTSSY